MEDSSVAPVGCRTCCGSFAKGVEWSRSRIRPKTLNAQMAATAKASKRNPRARPRFSGAGFGRPLEYLASSIRRFDYDNPTFVTKCRPVTAISIIFSQIAQRPALCGRLKREKEEYGVGDRIAAPIRP